MVRLSWTTVLRHVDRLYTQGTEVGCSDDQLLTRFAATRDESDRAFESIIQRHRPMVLEICRRLLGGDRHAAEDAFQTTLLVLARRGLTHDQAAASLQWPVGTVRGSLARARDLLRVRLVRRGVAPAVAIGLLNPHPASAAVMLPPPLVNSVLHAIAHGSAPSAVAALTGTILRDMAFSRVRRILLVFLGLALAAGGAEWVGLHFGWPAARQGPPRQEEIAVSQPARAPASRGHVDLHGDRLPDGAVARLGTNRFNHASNVGPVVFTPDGKAIISYGGDGLACVWLSSIFPSTISFKTLASSPARFEMWVM